MSAQLCLPNGKRCSVTVMLLRNDVDFGRWRLQKANITSLCDDLYKKDLLGNIIEILDTSGNTMVKYTYDAWGNHTVIDYTEFGLGDINPIRYRSYYYDTETGLYYLKSRYYDPQTGRFISRDDISYLDPETIGGANLYAYCLNNPVIYPKFPGEYVLNPLWRLRLW